MNLNSKSDFAASIILCPLCQTDCIDQVSFLFQNLIILKYFRY